VLAGGVDSFETRVNDIKIRSKMIAEMQTIFLQQTGSGPESIQFRNLDLYPNMQGKTLANFLQERNRPVTIDEAINAMIEFQIQGGFIGIFEGMSEEDVIRIVRHPKAMFETDGDLVEPGKGFPHPRSYGSFPRILAKYVRDEKVLTLEQAVQKMTSLPALWIGQNERGFIREGAIADLTVFDLNSIQDNATYIDPHRYSTGIIHVIINGVMVLYNSKMTGELPGQFLKRTRK